MQRKIASTAAFTLMEIIITVVVLGIMASVAIPKVLAPNEKIRSSEGQQILIALLGAQKRFALENAGAYAAALANLDITIPASTSFDVPQVFNDVNGVAAIQRTGGLYTLSIRETGVIICGDGTITCASIKCDKGGGGNQCN